MAGNLFQASLLERYRGANQPLTEGYLLPAYIPSIEKKERELEESKKLLDLMIDNVKIRDEAYAAKKQSSQEIFDRLAQHVRVIRGLYNRGQDVSKLLNILELALVDLSQ